MKYILSIGVGIFEAVVSIWSVLYLRKKKIKDIKVTSIELISCFIIVILSIAFSYKLLIQKMDWINYILLMVMYILLLTVAIIDRKEKVVPNKLIIFNLCLRLLLLVIEVFFYRELAYQILVKNVISLAITFIFLIIIVIISRSAIGFGDVKLLCIMSLYCGLTRTYNSFFIALIIAAIASIYYLIIKKRGREYRMAFVPFLYIGYVLTIILSAGA